MDTILNNLVELLTLNDQSRCWQIKWIFSKINSNKNSAEPACSPTHQHRSSTWNKPQRSISIQHKVFQLSMTSLKSPLSEAIYHINTYFADVMCYICLCHGREWKDSPYLLHAIKAQQKDTGNSLISHRDCNYPVRVPRDLITETPLIKTLSSSSKAHTLSSHSIKETHQSVQCR